MTFNRYFAAQCVAEWLKTLFKTRFARTNRFFSETGCSVQRVANFYHCELQFKYSWGITSHLVRRTIRMFGILWGMFTRPVEDPAIQLNKMCMICEKDSRILLCCL